MTRSQPDRGMTDKPEAPTPSILPGILDTDGAAGETAPRRGKAERDPQGGPVQLQGVVQRITFRNDANGYTVARLALEPTRGPSTGQGDASFWGQSMVTITGRFPSLSVGERLRVWGHWVVHPQFGRQLAVTDFLVVAPETLHGIRRYLGSGLIPGIGPVMAERLVAHFGVDTLHVITEHPERLAQVPGIGPKRAAAIAEALRRHQGIQRVMVFLQGLGISPAYAARIYRAYGDEAIRRVKENPYRLATDIAGIGFKTADRIAQSMGIAPDAPQRLVAGVHHVLQEAAENGHVYVPREALLAEAAGALGVAPEALAAPLAQLVGQEQAVADGDRIYLSGLYRAEMSVARLLVRLRDEWRLLQPVGAEARWEAAVAEAERKAGLQLSPQQRQAVLDALRQGVMVLTGGPGTGKTTILRVLLACLEAEGLRVQLACPTGRAAQRLREATGRPARTVHRLLEFGLVEGEGFRFQRNEERPLAADAVIVDEASMVDLPLAHHLLRAVAPGTRLVLVGDVDQLPPVGPGYPLRDIIASQAVPVARLTHIFRQAERSLIVTNAHRILRGEEPIVNRAGGDFFFIECEDPEEVAQTVLELNARRLPAYLGCDPIEDVQVLSPMRRSATGADRLNRLLQEALNPLRGEAAEVAGVGGLRVGDKVMQTRNNYEKQVFNGDIGRIEHIDPDTGTVRVRFPQADGPQVVEYAPGEIDELTLAYCITVHKSQGSEYPAVILPLTTQHYMMLQRNLLYTAVTRARKLVVIVGSRRALRLALRGVREEGRASGLAERLREAANE